MKKKTIDITGMHCTSCELLIEDELMTIPGVQKVTVSQPKGKAEIQYGGTLLEQDIARAVEKAGYQMGKEQRTFFSHNLTDYAELGVTIAGVFALLSLAQALGLFRIGGQLGTNYGSLPIVFLIGLTAGISTCMAVVGGLVLGASARFAEKHPLATTLQKFTPHLFFNLGRVVSYTLLGGLIGYLGSFLQISSSVLGMLTLVVGVVMLLLGLQLLAIVPGLNRFTLTLPKQISRAFGMKEKTTQEYSHKNAATMGALTFFLPCGFTQAMQLYATSTGSPVIGALTMGTFALGTAPGLLGIGGITSVVKGAFARHFFRFAGVVVMLLAIINITNGYTLSGLQNLSFPPVKTVLSSSTNQTEATSEKTGKTQLLTATYSTAEGFQPKELTVQAGVPARLEVLANDDGAGCMGSITLPGLSKNMEVFKKGQKVIFDFTAEQSGEYTIACAMGLPHGTIQVQ